MPEGYGGYREPEPKEQSLDALKRRIDETWSEHLKAVQAYNDAQGSCGTPTNKGPKDQP